MKYVLLDKAKDDASDAATYYDQQRLGLGTEFLIELGIGLARVLDGPQS